MSEQETKVEDARYLVENEYLRRVGKRGEVTFPEIPPEVYKSFDELLKKGVSKTTHIINKIILKWFPPLIYPAFEVGEYLKSVKMKEEMKKLVRKTAPAFNGEIERMLTEWLIHQKGLDERFYPSPFPEKQNFDHIIGYINYNLNDQKKDELDDPQSLIESLNKIYLKQLESKSDINITNDKVERLIEKNRMKFKFGTFYTRYISTETYESVKASYIGVEISPERLDELVFCVLVRYMSIDNDGIQMAAPILYSMPQAAEVELFGSPFNKSLSVYCSLYPDIDCYFGSVSSFFLFDLWDRYSTYSANPPYILHIMNTMSVKLIKVLNDFPHNKTFYLTLPVWKDFPAHDTLKSSGYITYENKENYKYLNRMMMQEHFLGRTHTFVIVLQNDIGSVMNITEFLAIVQPEGIEATGEGMGRKALSIKHFNPTEYCYTTLVMKGDGYVPGAIAAGQSLIETKSLYDRVCMITNDVSERSRIALSKVFTFVVVVPYISHPSISMKTARQKEMYSSWMDVSYTKWNCIAFTNYRKVLFVDADAVVLHNIDHIFGLKSPGATFSSPWAEPFVKGGMYNPYSKIEHGGVVTKKQVQEGLERSFIGAGSIVLLSPDIQKYSEFITILSDPKPYGHKGSYSSFDEQILADLYDDWTNISQIYNAIPWKENWVKGLGEPQVYHYTGGEGNKKVWNMELGKYDDVKIWRGFYERATLEKKKPPTSPKVKVQSSSREQKTKTRPKETKTKPKKETKQKSKKIQEEDEEEPEEKSESDEEQTQESDSKEKKVNVKSPKRSAVKDEITIGTVEGEEPEENAMGKSRKRKSLIVTVIGTRVWNDYSLVVKELSKIKGITEILSGGATGADSLAKKYADENNIEFRKEDGYWNLGKKGGPIRTKSIVSQGDIIVAFWDGKSIGTSNGIDFANQFKKPLIIVYPSGKVEKKRFN